MGSILGIALLTLALVTSVQHGREHRPITALLAWNLVATSAMKEDLPRLVLYALTVSAPVAVFAVAWASLHPPYLRRSVVLFGLLTVVSTVAAWQADGKVGFSYLMAGIWCMCAVGGAPAVFLGTATAHARAVVVILLFGLPCEAVGWIAWGCRADAGFDFARYITRATLLLIIWVQLEQPSRSIVWTGLTRWARLTPISTLRREPTKIEPPAVPAPSSPRH